MRRVRYSIAALVWLAAGCGGGQGGQRQDSPPSQTPPPNEAQCGASPVSFTSTFGAIQKLVFERHGCTESVCHGAARAGGLDLAPAEAYRNLVDVRSSGSSLDRVAPGQADRSTLWLKLAAKTRPGSVEIAGAPMPQTQPAISERELDAIREWILDGAPETGTVPGTDRLLDACLPPVEPIVVTPLPPPAHDEGVQFVMPEWSLPAASEHETCFASYYDISAQVPKRFQDETGTRFFISAIEIRQDPQSHHLGVNRYIGTRDIHDPSFGEFTCKGGSRAGEPCEPTDSASCGDGVCGSEVFDTVGCIGFGPQDRQQTYYPIASSVQMQSQTTFPDGVYSVVPLRGIVFWNSHAFNLTTKDTTMHARVNFRYAGTRSHPAAPILGGDRIFDQRTPPFGKETLCSDFLLPEGARLFNLGSHTHKRGKRFTVETPDGALIYESFDYRDPVDQLYDPPLVFDSPLEAKRKLHYCALYVNGLSDDGLPDPTTVKRRSTTPRNALEVCRPTACVSGRLAAPCDGEGDDRSCDSSPGANDGSCDACELRGGVSTEDEMLLLRGGFYVDQGGS